MFSSFGTSSNYSLPLPALNETTAFHLPLLIVPSKIICNLRAFKFVANSYFGHTRAVGDCILYALENRRSVQ